MSLTPKFWDKGVVVVVVVVFPPFSTVPLRSLSLSLSVSLSLKNTKLCLAAMTKSLTATKQTLSQHSLDFLTELLDPFLDPMVIYEVFLVLTGAWCCDVNWYEVLIENLMDPAHVPYAHHGIMRIPKRPGPARPDREGGRPLDINVETINVNGYISKQEFGFSNFIAPCLYYAYPSLESNNASVSSSSIQEKSSGKTQQKKQRVLLIFFCIPVSPGRSRVIWVFPRNFAVWIDKLVPRWMFHIGQNLILDSDLYLLHVEEHKIAEVGPANWQTACFVPTKSDAQVIAFRKWLRKYSHDKVDWGSKSNELLPPTPPREQLMDRYWSHVVNCSSCRAALKGLKALEVSLQIISIFSIGIIAAAKENLISAMTKTTVVSMALLCFVASRWLAHFIHKTFYYHDYNHAFR